MTTLSKPKQLLSALVALIVALMMATPASAATITINDAVENQTYTAYKVFDVTNSGDAYAYTTSNETLVTAVQGAVENGTLSGITFTKNSAGTYNVTVNEDAGFSAANFAAWISDNLDSLSLGNGTRGVISEGTATITLEEAGYYFVTSSVGTLCFLQTTDSLEEINEKNQAPIVNKKADVSTVTIGQTVTFDITITAQPGAESYVLHDTMSSGLSFSSISSVVAGEDTLTANTDYTVSTETNDECTFEISFSQDYLDTITEATDIVVTYTATVTANAITVNAENEAYLSYGDSAITSTTSKVSLPTYSFDLVKIDEDSSLLSGAEFKLYTSEESSDPIYVVAAESGYRVATSSTDAEGNVTYETGATDTIVVLGGSVTIDGLASGTYYLEETTAPDGYNQLTSRVSVTIDDADNSAIFNNETGKYVSGGAGVVNKAGSLLPSTGGMGTTVLYAVGALLVIGAGVALVVRLRNRHEC